MAADGTWSIGELAARAGTTVKTVRFYSEQGLLPEAARSIGGHRRYWPEALGRLATIRSLRALDLPVAEVRRVLERDELDGPLEDAVARQLGQVGEQLAALRWREAALRLLHECGPAERAERLRLVGAVTAPPSTDVIARFWRRWLPARMPRAAVALVLERTVPQIPADPTPEQVLAFARLHAMTRGECEGGDRGQPAAHRSGRGFRPAVLYAGLDEAYALAAPAVRAGRAPGGGDALDCFVAAYAAAGGGARDTAAFRRGLGPVLAADPRIDRYWDLVAEIAGPGEVTPGAAHAWLVAALAVPLG
ncbi:DNA-binding transcriptional regulator, MerR family [Actinacidiphila rubida]|uniref:DNA-binding transcriptional regulator, MerR family n=2 Tax=Actinacidiphila rubida TaxID=310780 RepID=A0A1H8F638_9ACTN|nr:MerR family transcriptional regulator [Actinacidiphila rubida]SEN27331.1 DNA-binding transcriptional regulator, MerR family [Actinacidiphila rubida]